MAAENAPLCVHIPEHIAVIMIYSKKQDIECSSD